MEVTLEKIELVKDRTGVSYKEAKEALEAADGSVVDAIISIEESLDGEGKKSIGEQGTAVIDKVKGLVKKGNVSRIVVKKKDGEQLLNLPVNAGVIATILAPGGVLVSLIAAYGFKCNVEVIKTVREKYPTIHITAAISNISFNLPVRKLVNSGFMVLAMNYGLDSGILDPTNRDMLGLIYATEALLGMDDYCMEYISAYRDGLIGPIKK